MEYILCGIVIIFDSNNIVFFVLVSKKKGILYNFIN